MKTYDPKKSTNEARQGNQQKGNLRVLIWSTSLIIVAFAVIYVIYNVTQSGAAG